jgi:hypothetical protein
VHGGCHDLVLVAPHVEDGRRNALHWHAIALGFLHGEKVETPIDMRNIEKN